MKFRFVDKITSLKKNKTIEGVKMASFEEISLLRKTGIKKSLPPTLMAEAMFQLGNFLIYKSFKNKLAHLIMFNRIRIHNPLHPGDVMMMRVNLVSVIDDCVKLDGMGCVDDRVAIEGNGCIGKLLDIEKLWDPEKFEILFKSLYQEGIYRHDPDLGQASSYDSKN